METPGGKPFRRVLPRFLFILATFLFHWPFLISHRGWPQPFSFYFMFICWGLIIVALFFLTRPVFFRRRGGPPEGDA